MVLTLYGNDASPPTAAIYMLINKLNLDVERVQVNLLAKEQLSEKFLKMNPQHTIPTLKDGEFCIWESHAIAPYLVTVYGKDDALYPTDPKKRAVVDQRLHFDTGILFQAMGQALKPVVYGDKTSLDPEVLDKIKEAYDFTEKFLTKTWIAGDELTVADMSCVSSISILNIVLPIENHVHPKLWKWFRRISAEDFYKKGNTAEPLLSQFLSMKLKK